MSSFRIRPRFQQEFVSTPEEMEQLFRDRIEHEKDFCDCRAVFRPGHIIIKVPDSERHYWSPQLSLSIEKEEDSEKTLVRGLYGPHPSVWTMFAMSYLVLGIASVFAGIIGYSYHLLDKNAWMLWLIPVFAGIALILYMIAQFGQKLGAEHTFRLHHFYEETVGRRAEID
jgi:hypothetical protein